jgi:hypothetical protein
VLCVSRWLEYSNRAARESFRFSVDGTVTFGRKLREQLRAFQKMTIENRPSLSAKRIWLARGIAACADLVQIFFFPMFSEGIASPLNAGLDVAVGVTLVLLVGWHIAFIPTFIIESLPFADLAPTWTLAAVIATRGRGGKAL